MKSTESTILVVDDEELFRGRLARAFAKRGLQVFTAADYGQAIEIIGEHRPAMAVIDLKMPGRSGLDLIADGRKIHPGLRCVVLTGYGSIATATEATKLGALYYLPKPADADDILKAFARDPGLRLDLTEDDWQPPSLARMEWEHINRVLRDCDGNISSAAKKLGIHRRSLQRKLQKYPPGS
ncbi:MAG: response regulator [Desulfobacteraceae bacterium]|nr:response regulator [Desulfobacteraceae bacterium]